MELEIGRLIEACGGRMLVSPADDAAIARGLTWDSRDVEPGFVYAAIVGERVDGHAFVESAIRAGAVCALCSAEPSAAAIAAALEAGGCIVVVEDVPAAIAAIASAWRDELDATVIGVTGSVGKTTTKGLVRDILSTKYKTWATKGNFNNELGAPYTVISAPAGTQMLVVEMGMDRPGQIAHLAGMAKPDMGIVSIVGTSHLEYLKTRENIALAKAELLDALPEGGRAFVNASCDMTPLMVEHSRLTQRGVSVCAFSSAGEPEASLGAWAAGDAVWAEDISVDGQGHPRFTLCARGAGLVGEGERRASATLSLRGAQNVSNACGAVGVCLACGMTFDEVVAALEAAQPEAGRAELVRAKCGAVVFNDAYNAAPESMCAAIATLAAYEASGRRIAVLGDMGELGCASAEGHARAGRAAASAGIDALVCVGELSRGTARAAEEAGMPRENIVRVANADEALAYLTKNIAEGDAVLVKASHYMGLDRVVEGIVE